MRECRKRSAPRRGAGGRFTEATEFAAAEFSPDKGDITCLTPAQITTQNGVLFEFMELCPILSWPAFTPPKRYRRMPTGTSSISVLVPQTIHLGPGAFRDEESPTPPTRPALRYLGQDVPGRHVRRSLRRRRHLDGETHVRERLHYLTGYLDGCLTAMDERPYGSPAGDLVKHTPAGRLDDLTRHFHDPAIPGGHLAR